MNPESIGEAVPFSELPKLLGLPVSEDTVYLEGKMLNNLAQPDVVLRGKISACRPPAESDRG